MRRSQGITSRYAWIAAISRAGTAPVRSGRSKLPSGPLPAGLHGLQLSRTADLNGLQLWTARLHELHSAALSAWSVTLTEQSSSRRLLVSTACSSPRTVALFL